MKTNFDFVDDVRKAVDSLEEISEVRGLLDNETLSMLRSLHRIDVSEMKQAIDAAEVLQNKFTTLETVERGLEDIEEVVDMQNQVNYVSEMRDIIKFIAANMETIIYIHNHIWIFKILHENVDAFKQLVLMKDDISGAIAMAEDIEITSKIAEQIRDDIATFEKDTEQIKKDVQQAANLMNAAGQAERRIDEKIKQMEEIEARMQQFRVEVVHTGPEIKASSKYNPSQNKLMLSIPSGKQGEPGPKGEKGAKGDRGVPGSTVEKGDKGDRGDPGRDGKNFRIDAMGNKRDMKKYKNMPIGFSFLSLDENPTMIYFRKSNTTDKWTDGQPFGLTDGEEARITVSDSQRLGGFTLEQIMQAIKTNVEKVIYTKEKHGSTS